MAGILAIAGVIVPAPALATLSGVTNDPVTTGYVKPLSFEGESVGRIGSALGSGLDLRVPAIDVSSNGNASNAAFSSSTDILDDGRSPEKEGLKTLIAILVLLGATRKYLTSAKYQEFLDGVYGPLDGY